jgi:hypothetical protein
LLGQYRRIDWLGHVMLLLADSNVFVLLCHLDCRSGWLATLAAM